MSDRKIGIAIATYDRPALTLASFAEIYADSRVSDVAISDDGSRADVFAELIASTRDLEKVRLMLNPMNAGSWANKKQAVALSIAEWVILLDSDNVVRRDYLDVLFAQEWDEDILYVPVRGVPALDYAPYAGLIIDKQNVGQQLDQTLFQMLLNTGNFFVHRESHLLVSDGLAEESYASDGIYFIYRWLASGRKVFVTPNLSYEHLVHEGHWTKTAGPSLAFAAELLRRMRENVWEAQCAA